MVVDLWRFMQENYFIKLQTLRDEISSAHIRDGVPETTNIHYDPRTNTSNVGFHNFIQKISGDYKLEVGGSMNFSVLGLPNPNPVAFAQTLLLVI